MGTLGTNRDENIFAKYKIPMYCAGSYGKQVEFMGSHKGIVYRSATSDEAGLIDKRLPVAGRPRIFPFFDMEVGESVIIVDPESKGSARSSANNAARVNGWKFKTRTLPDGSLIVKRIS